MKQPNNIMMIM